MVNLDEQIKLLMELQNLDTHIFGLEDDLAAMPETTKRMEGDFNEKSANLKAMEDSLKALQVKRKEKEGELESKEVTIKKYQAQLYQIKTNKEYTALQEEIGRIRADNSLIEDDVIKMLDQIDVENKRIVKEKEFLKQEEIKLAEEKKRLTENASGIKAELEGLNKTRAELAEKVDKGILAKYEKIIKSKDGLAVVAVRDDACHGCFRVMPPQVINEIKMKNELVFCENCNRILYIEE